MILKVIVHPRSKKPRIERDLLGILHIHVKEPAIDNKANKALITDIAKEFCVSLNNIKIKHGTKSKVKLIEIKDTRGDLTL